MNFEGQYLTYAEYIALGGSAIDEMPFNLLEFRSRKEIDNRTQSRLKDTGHEIQEVKLCDFELISKIKAFTSYENRDVTVSSENIDGYSVSYGDINKEFTETQKREINNTIDNYLGESKLPDGTPYLYRG